VASTVKPPAKIATAEGTAASSLSTDGAPMMAVHAYALIDDERWWRNVYMVEKVR
jgi:hypothetical protein